MKIYSYNGQPIQLGGSFNINGIQYPYNWFDLTPDGEVIAAGFTIDVQPDPKKTFIYSQDLIAQFTPADVTAITSAVSTNASMALLWYSLLAQKDAMEVSNARFQAGWAALTQVLGADRMAAIATDLNI